ncbi:DMT family transporter [Thiohalobacter thiocyanaticus]|uniref:DMT family transporter n=1 Tax=Thiohalobacter thiocyanaticus TaxID=585455 RepID=A0A426QL27_9GAMM|nr:DMT family transporter [Thiohalobacter thiocyanaticus]RRQ22458.1 DMT family transporter [Thiohalobacter thiocyanaticus]
MSVPAAYLGVILIWSTTPLAIQWSGEGGGFLFGVTARMLLGALLCLALMGALSIPLPRHRRAWTAYLAAGVGIYAAMLSVYWAAQFIPSGLISVVFGLAPIVTGLMAALWLEESAFTPGRVLGMLLGVSGLAVIFEVGGSLGDQAVYGIAGVTLAVVLHSASAVWVKRIDAGLHPLSQTGGGLLVAAPLYALTWGLADGGLPMGVSERALMSIGYLALMGSVLGFMLYYYALKHLPATRLALIPLITPVLALLLGALFNGETLQPRMLLGVAVVLAGLMAYQWGDRLRPVRRQALAEDEASGL